jgi:hypothetical protein
MSAIGGIETGGSRPDNNGDSSQSLAADVTAEPDADASGAELDFYRM